MDKTEIERLAFAQALYSKLGEIVSTKDPDSLRAAVDEFYKDLYETTGAKSFEVSIDGQKVGTYSVRVSKPKPAETKERLVIADSQTFETWIDNETNEEILQLFARSRLEEFANCVFEETGEIPYGCFIEQTVSLAQPARYSGGALKVDPLSVLDAMQGKLGTAVKGILGGGE